jgi:hypothetical protein
VYPSAGGKRNEEEEKEGTRAYQGQFELVNPHTIKIKNANSTIPTAIYVQILISW